MKKVCYVFVFLFLGAMLLSPQQASAQNIAPPSGAILDLSGRPLPSTYTLYTVDFTATLSSTDVTFAFRNDPGWTVMDDVSVIDLTTGSPTNLISNGAFQSGTLGAWTYDNVYGAAFGGSVATSCTGNQTPRGSDTYEWCDGATQAYDAIDQVISTHSGDSYQISFYMEQADATGFSPANFQDLSTNGNPGTDGNGVDTLVYVGSTIPAATPEPGSLVLFGSGLIGLAGALRRKLLAR